MTQMEPWLDLPELYTELHARGRLVSQGGIVYRTADIAGQTELDPRPIPTPAQPAAIPTTLLIRSVFSFIEAVTFAVKEMALLWRTG